MPELGNLLRIALLQLLEGKLSEPDQIKFKAWLIKSRTAEYYFEKLLTLESVVDDLKCLSKEWNDSIETKAWDTLELISNSQRVTAPIDEAFRNSGTFLRYRDNKLQEEFSGHGDADFMVVPKPVITLFKSLKSAPGSPALPQEH